jgi:hypothetical protein
MSGNNSIEQVDAVDAYNADSQSVDEADGILIRSSSATNGMTTMLIGAVVATIGILIIMLLPQMFFLVGILFISGSIIAFVMGYYKMREPKFSLNITKEAIYYKHRKGVWEISWQNIQRMDVPKVHKGLEHIDLEMVGFRLKDPEAFLGAISPRLVTHLLMEQRPLAAHVAMSNCESGQCYGDDIIEDTKYKLKDGTLINGVNAMFANRMRKLQAGLGYDVYLSVNDIDRSGSEFVTLLRECHDSIKQEEIEALKKRASS